MFKRVGDSVAKGCVLVLLQYQWAARTTPPPRPTPQTPRPPTSAAPTQESCSLAACWSATSIWPSTRCSSESNPLEVSLVPRCVIYTQIYDKLWAGTPVIVFGKNSGEPVCWSATIMVLCSRFCSFQPIYKTFEKLCLLFFSVGCYPGRLFLTVFFWPFFLKLFNLICNF